MSIDMKTLHKKLYSFNVQFNFMGGKQHSLTYLLTPWCRVLPEQLTGSQLVKKFPAYHGTQRFITALTSVRKKVSRASIPHVNVS